MRKVNAIVPYFGANRMLAESVGEALDGCRWVGVPFAGSMAEIQFITARSVVVSDLHLDVINLARCIGSPASFTLLRKILERKCFHPAELADAQRRCKAPADQVNVYRAADYFVSQWMGRSGNAGTDKEFAGNLSSRWNANGGDSCRRYRSAVKSLALWHRVMRRCNFHCMDAFAFISRCLDTSDNGIYCDPPWPCDGAEYVNKFTDDHHRRLAILLSTFKNARIVLRYGERPLIRELYPESEWEWRTQTSRTQGNSDKLEVLIVRTRGSS